MKFFFIIFILNLFQNDIYFNNRLEYKLLQLKTINKKLSNEDFHRIKKELILNIENEFLLYKSALKSIKLTKTDILMELDKFKTEQQNSSLAAIALKYGKTEDELLKDIKVDIYKNKFLREVLLKDIKVKDKELRDYYKSKEKIFIQNEKYLICQIFSISKFKLNIALKKLKHDKFEDIAKKYSEAPEAKNGGCLSWRFKNELPSFFSVAFKMKKSKISKIIRSQYGYHIFLLKDKLKKKKITFNNVKNKIKKKLILKKQNEKLKEFYKKSRINFKNEN